tara:strand:- start:25 stop:621 length:597 start_codon:yes stop_codon:yes gene_type:complete
MQYPSWVLLLIDNYDSFTWNLAHCIGVMAPSMPVQVVRNDAITPDEVVDLKPTHIVLSPGPCTPAEAGVCGDVVRTVAGSIPLLGVCLGHQVIADVFGMQVVRHDRPMHGRTSMVHHDGEGIFQGMDNPFEAARYHSLIVDRKSVAQDFVVSAWTDEGEVMGLRKCTPGAPLLGVQFHPESFMSPAGPSLIAAFLGAH